ncbi:radical SAM family heme chaperone HemW [Hydrogenibacillus schlegelii]|uniref:radical SAM family heme chaperone HemW n=1 Tax=Hydrogenibacillus schlegelii TaxID=1484 RepID=UPI00082D4BF3|nr:radical SAM family heme chaperone HemW [Hydrogenibacillus schlegelii]
MPDPGAVERGATADPAGFAPEAAPRHVYVHVPFCGAKCHYCDFAVFVGPRTPWEALYLEALERELALVLAPYGGAYPFPIETLYLGGGTPTALSPAALERLFDLLERAFPRRAPGMEWTVEANPEGLVGDEGRALLRWLRGRGTTRLSIGVQTFDDAQLSALGRRHTGREAEAAVLAAREAGFVHLSLDLIYGLPGQTFEGWTADVRRAFGLPIDHLSAYALEVAEATRFGRMQAAGALPLPDDDRVVEMYAFVAAAARDAGFEPYEVSNFARPGGRSRHNLAYWNNRPYFGFGPGAHGYAFGVRTANVPSLPRYVRARTLSEFRTEVRPVGRREAIEETMFLGLRLAEGVRRDAFRRRFGVDLEDVYGPVLRRLEAEGLIVIDARGIRLPEAVRPVMNAVLAEFLFDDR